MATAVYLGELLVRSLNCIGKRLGVRGILGRYYCRAVSVDSKTSHTYICTIMPVPSLSLKLRHLPLRPSTLATFEKRGFVTTLEMVASKRSGGITNLAAELGCTLSEAASLVREVELAAASVHPSGSSHLDSSTKPASSTTVLLTTLVAVVEHAPPPPKTTSVMAASLLTQSRKSSFQRNIVTFCRSIDTLLDGGMNLSELT